MYRNPFYRQGGLDLSAAGFYTPWDPSTAAPGEENPQRVMGHDPYGVDRAPNLGGGTPPVPMAKPSRSKAAPRPIEPPVMVPNPLLPPDGWVSPADHPQGEAYGPMRGYDQGPQEQPQQEMPPLEDGGYVPPAPGQGGQGGGPRQLLPDQLPQPAPQVQASDYAQAPQGQRPEEQGGPAEKKPQAKESGGLWGESIADLATSIGIGLLSSTNPQEGIAAGLQQWQSISAQKRKEKAQKDQFDREMALRERGQAYDERSGDRRLGQGDRQMDMQGQQFDRGFGLDERKVDMQGSQFDRGFGLDERKVDMQGRQFADEMGYKERALTQDDRHFGSQLGMQAQELAQRGDLARAGMAQDDRHFSGQMGMQERELTQRGDLARAGMAQDDRHFSGQMGMQAQELAQRGDLARAGMAQDDRHFDTTAGFQSRELGLRASEQASMDRFRALGLAMDGQKMIDGRQESAADRASREKIAGMTQGGSGWESQVLPSSDGQSAVVVRRNSRTGEVQTSPVPGVAAGLSMVSPGVKADQDTESGIYTNARVAKDRVDQLQTTQQLLAQNPGVWGQDVQSKVWRGFTSALGLDPSTNLQQVQQLGASGELDQAIAKMSKQGQITENERLLLKRSLIDPTSMNPEAANILLPKLIGRAQEDIDKADAYSRTPRDQRGSAREWEFRWDQDRRNTKGGPMSGQSVSGTTPSGVKWSVVQ